MKKKDTLIAEINQYLLNKDIESVSFPELGKSFETSTGTEEGEIEVIGVSHGTFLYYPAGFNEETFDGYLTDLSVSDLEEIISALDDHDAADIQTQKRIR